MIGKVTRIGNLLDFYGALLTDRQREMVELHYLDDWSLAEIAENVGVTRQAVHDNLRRAEEQMGHYESALHLLEAHEARRALVHRLLSEWSTIVQYVPEANRRDMEQALWTLSEEYRV